jgi:hypothetical protein
MSRVTQPRGVGSLAFFALEIVFHPRRAAIGAGSTSYSPTFYIVTRSFWKRTFCRRVHRVHAVTGPIQVMSKVRSNLNS